MAKGTAATLLSAEKVKKSREWLEHYGIDTDEMNDDEVLEKVDKIKATVELKSEILMRGTTSDGMQKLLDGVPKGYVGEFKRSRNLDIQLAESQGWKVMVDEKLSKLSDTPSSDGTVILGDCVLMIIPDYEYVAMRVATKRRRAERRRAHSPKAQAEEARAAGINILEFP